MGEVECAGYGYFGSALCVLLFPHTHESFDVVATHSDPTYTWFHDGEILRMSEIS
jgi:hypothetical protein